MRLFVAIELPSELRRRLGDSLAELRTSLPRARWVRAENLHLTLAFLGETPESEVPEIGRVLAEVFGGRPGFRLELESPGHFPERGRARVAWIGFGDSAALSDLERELRQALEEELGRAPEQRAFHPHLTVARCSPPWPAAAAATWRAAAVDGLGEGLAVRRGVLVESRLGAGGARYSIVHSYPLEGAACSRPA